MNNFWKADTKEKFHIMGRSFGRALLKRLGLEGDVRSCKGGPGVWGEVIIHTNNFYIQFCHPKEIPWTSPILYRKCTSKKDYVGLKNYFTSYDKLEELINILKSWSTENS